MASTTAASDDIKLGEAFAFVWKEKLKVLLGGLAGGLLMLVYLANTLPTYQADALMQLEDRRGSMAVPSSVASLMSGDARSATEIEVLRSRLVLRQVVAELNLDWSVEPFQLPFLGTMFARYRFALLDGLIPPDYARPGERLVLSELIVPPRWLNTAIVLSVLPDRRFALALPDGTVVEGAEGVSTTLPERGFTITVDEIAAPPGRRFRLRQVDELQAIENLRGRVQVLERGRASGILEARLIDTSRQGAERILNAVIQSYQRQNIARSAAEAESSLTFIRSQIPTAEAALRAAEAELNAFRLEQVTVDLSLETQTLLNQISRVEGELIELTRREDELRQRFTPAHPMYRMLLDERARTDERLAALREQVGELPETQRQILNLTREVELALRIYTDLQTRAQEIEVLRASTIGNVRIIDAAVAGLHPIAPRRVIMMAVGIILGLLGGLAYIILRNVLRKGVQDSRELERLGLPVFATINYSKSADTAGKRRGRMPILALEQPDDLTVEALRSLRTSLHFGMLDARTPTLTLTSSHPGAGKSFLSMNLAVVAAQGGQSICLIDADMRRGQLRRYFDQPRDAPGLANVLAGDLDPDRAVIPGPVDGLHFMGTGRYPPNPAELLMRPQMAALIDWCTENFDLTLFDTPPVLAVTDPVILARATGATVFIARHDLTSMAEVESSLKIFAASGQKFTGTILNGFDPRKAKSGDAAAYGYRYDYKRRPE
jgi:tyrosine-protein kinase Etk/Wzc